MVRQPTGVGDRAPCFSAKGSSLSSISWDRSRRRRRYLSRGTRPPRRRRTDARTDWLMLAIRDLCDAGDSAQCFCDNEKCPREWWVLARDDAWEKASELCCVAPRRDVPWVWLGTMARPRAPAAALKPFRFWKSVPMEAMTSASRMSAGRAGV